MRYVLTRGDSSGETLGELVFPSSFYVATPGRMGYSLVPPPSRPPDLVFASGTLILLNRFALLLFYFHEESTSNQMR